MHHCGGMKRIYVFVAVVVTLIIIMAGIYVYETRPLPVSVHITEYSASFHYPNGSSNGSLYLWGQAPIPYTNNGTTARGPQFMDVLYLQNNGTSPVSIVNASVIQNNFSWQVNAVASPVSITVNSTDGYFPLSIPAGSWTQVSVLMAYHGSSNYEGPLKIVLYVKI